MKRTEVHARYGGRMMTVGLTGGVGAGKSTVLKYLEGLPGVRVIQADLVGHRVMEPGTDCFGLITNHFGEEIEDADGSINRGRLADIVYSDKNELAFLNSVIHPAVKRYIKEEIKDAVSSGGVYLFVIEAALLIEDHYEEICDEFWYVYAPESVRRERLKSSRGYSDGKIEGMMRSQLDDAAFRRACSEVIDNGQSPEETVRQVRDLLVRKGFDGVLFP